MHIEAAKSERPWADKGHDRVVLLEDMGRFALFDGAGQAMASDIALETFTSQHSEHVSSDSRPLPFLNDVFGEIHARILKFQEEIAEAKYSRYAKNIVTTGTALGLRTLTNGSRTPILELAHAGDSSLWMLDRDAGSLTKLTHDDIIGSEPENCIPDIRNWLGGEGHVLTQWFGRPLRASRAVFALFSDGVGSYEDHGGAITEWNLQEIMASNASVQNKADWIIGASSIRDDASAIVVEVTA